MIGIYNYPMIKVIFAQVSIIIFQLSFDVARADVLDATSILNGKLISFGKYYVVGVFQPPNACVPTPSHLEYLSLVGVGGTIPGGLEIGGPETVLSVTPLAHDKKTFQNCNTVPAMPSANFSATYSESLSVTLSTTLSQSISVDLRLGAGSPTSGSAALGINSGKTWSTTESSTISVSKGVTQGDSYSTSVAPGKEVDIEYTVFSSRTRLPVKAQGIFDGHIYPCQQRPNGKEYASDFLDPNARTLVASGYIEFDNAQSGTFKVSPPRPIQCPSQGLNIINRD